MPLRKKDKIYSLSLLVLIALSILTLHADGPDFGQQQDRGLIENDAIDEASGLAASRQHPGVLWTHNDSGDLPRIFALDTHGRSVGQIFLNAVSARDWEDIAVGPGPVAGQEYIYVGDVGDNNSRFTVKTIYRVADPGFEAGQSPKDTTLSDFDVIRFEYPDGKRDAESVMVDPLTADIYVISKRESRVHVYRLAFPQSTSEVNTAEFVGTLDLTNVVAGDISPDGMEILVKTYGEIFYWQRSAGESIAGTLAQAPVKVPYVPEPQGEAVTWSGDASGYFTISEEFAGIPARLYFYPRVMPTPVETHPEVPTSLNLQQNYPNPFNPTTKIRYSLEAAARVNLAVYDLRGREVAVLSNEFQPADDYEVEFDGGKLASGIYFYALKSGSQQQVRKLLLVK